MRNFLIFFIFISIKRPEDENEKYTRGTFMGSVIEIKRKRRVTELIKNLNIVAIGKWYLSPYDPPFADNNESDMIMWRMQRRENKKE